MDKTQFWLYINWSHINYRLIEDKLCNNRLAKRQLCNNAKLKGKYIRLDIKIVYLNAKMQRQIQWQI